jgi:hypothetical protein
LNSLSELTDDLESQLKQFDETTGRIAALSGTLESLQLDAKNVQSNTDNLDLTVRAKKLAAITDQINVLKPDLEAHQASAAQQKKVIVLASRNLRGRCMGEAAGRAQTRSREVVTELERDFDIKRLPVGISQIGEAHKTVQELRGTERLLQSIDSTPEAQIDFARRVRTDFLGKLS